MCEDDDSETVIGKAPPQKQKIFFAFCDGSAKSSARNETWIQCTECFLRAHVECLDAENHMYFCEYSKQISCLNIYCLYLL